MTTRTRKNLLYGALAVLVAAVVIVRALNVLPPYIDDILGRAFPVVLVIVGLSVLLRNRVPYSGFIAVVMGFALVTVISTTAFSVRRGQTRDDNRIEITEEVRDEIVLLRVRVQTLTTDVEIVRAPQTEDDTLRAVFTGSTESSLSETYIAGTDNAATFTLNELRQNPVPMLEAVGRGSLLLELPPDVPVDLQLDALDGDVVLNLSELQLERLNLNITEGDTLVTLPAYEPQYSEPEETLGAWRVGTGTTTVRVPGGVSARFDMSQSTGPEPDYDPNVYNLLFGRDVLEARNIDTGEIVMRYDLVVQRERLTVDIIPDADAPDAN